MFSEKFNNLDPEDYYMSEEGFIVFTEKYHLKRGYCCKSGCRHCPYGYNKKTGLFDKKETKKYMTTQEFKKTILAGIPSGLPSLKEFDKTLNPPPKRKDILNQAEK